MPSTLQPPAATTPVQTATVTPSDARAGLNQAPNGQTATTIGGSQFDNRPSFSVADVLRDQIDAAKAGVGTYAKISDDETAGKAQSLRSRLNELSGEADKKREALKRPHLEAGKAIDKEWQPLVKSAKEAADGIRSALSAYETDKLARQRRAERDQLRPCAFARNSRHCAAVIST